MSLGSHFTLPDLGGGDGMGEGSNSLGSGRQDEEKYSHQRGGIKRILIPSTSRELIGYQDKKHESRW